MNYIVPPNFNWANIPNTHANSILEIIHSFNINSQSVILPPNITLKFNGGKFTNYASITGNDTRIIADLVQIFDPMINGLNGSWNVKEAYPQWFGAKGDGINDDTISIQSTLDLSLSVYLSTPKTAYRVTSPLILKGGQKITGSSKSDGIARHRNLSNNVKGIWGNMSVNGTEIFQLGNGADSTKRKMTFYDIFAYNDNGPVIKSRYCTEFGFFGCEFRSRFYHCIDTQQSYLFGFYNCSIGASGTINNRNTEMAVATYMMDNSNGVLFSNCRMSGGTAGGVARIGKSYNLKFDNCVFESTKFGIYIASEETDVNISGAVHAISIIDCQWEQCSEPLNIGIHYACLGLRIEGAYISNSQRNIINDRDVAIKLGRVEGAVIKGIIFELNSDEFAWEFIYNPQGGEFVALKNSEISNITYKNVSADKVWKTSGFINDAQRSILSKNKIQLPEEYIGEKSEYITTVISCFGGTFNPAYRQISNLSSFGGQLLKVEILDASGPLSGNLYIGYSQNQAEYLRYDLSTADVIDGYSLIFDTPSGKNLRAGELFRLRVIGGRTLGNFRLKITYK